VLEAAAHLAGRNIRRYWSVMRTSEPAPSSSSIWIDLPVPDEPLPVYPDLPLAAVYALVEQSWAYTVYDDGYYERSFRSKNPEPFVM
jgi:hypothetical protein